MGSRRLSREIALKTLFCCDFNGNWTEEFATGTLSYFSDPDIDLDYLKELVKGTINNRARIDKEITSSSENWSINRMTRVDRNILRLSCFELIFCSDTPSNVIINEGIEIAKEYGSEDSPSFINGVLDKSAKRLKKAQEIEVETYDEDGAFVQVGEMVVAVKAER